MNVWVVKAFGFLDLLNFIVLPYLIQGVPTKLPECLGVPNVGGTFPTLCSGGTSIFGGT